MGTTQKMESRIALDVSLFGEDVRKLVQRARAINGPGDEIARSILYDMECAQPDPVMVNLSESELRHRTISTSVSLSYQMMNIIHNILN